MCGVPGLVNIFKSILALPVWLAVLIFYVPFGKHLWIRPLLKLSYIAGRLPAYMGLSLIRLRD